jgi:hypothetical protein
VNHYISGQNVLGYTTLNLDNSSNDPSFMREVLFAEMMNEHIPTPKAAYVHLTINGEDWGLYPNIQQANSPFLREWFFSNNGSLWRARRPDGQDIGSWGDGTAAINWLGPDTNTYKTFYDLDRTEQTQPWDDLVEVARILNNTPLAVLEDSLNKYMNVDRALWFLASEIAFGDRASYVRKGKDDYLLYYEPESGRMTPLQLDARSSMRMMHADWSPFYNADNSNYPLLNRLLAVPALRQRYLAHMRTIVREMMVQNEFNARVAGHAAVIDAAVLDDPKKLYTHDEFIDELQVLQDFINVRRMTLNANFEMSQQAPVISQVEHRVEGELWAQPLTSQSVNVRAHVTSTNGISAVRLYYCHGLFGPFTRVTMFDDGQHDDGAAGDGIFGATIPAASPLTRVRYYIEAVSANASQTASYEPAGAEHDVYTYQVQHPALVDPPVRVNEILAWNTWIVHDEFMEYDDWIEFYNTTSQPFDLSGHWLSDNGLNLQKWQFPQGSIIPALGYKIIWADNQPHQGANHASFALNNNGESVWLSTQDGTIMDHVIFGPQLMNIAYARRPNGYGPFEYQEPTFNMNNDNVSIHELDGPQLVRIYPNPATTSLTLVSEDRMDIVIHDALMREMYSGRLQGRSDIDVSEWAAGTYFLRHAGGVQKVVVVR